jgi:hypothetical protein
MKINCDLKRDDKNIVLHFTVEQTNGMKLYPIITLPRKDCTFIQLEEQIDMFMGEVEE